MAGTIQKFLGWVMGVQWNISFCTVLRFHTNFE